MRHDDVSLGCLAAMLAVLLVLLWFFVFKPTHQAEEGCEARGGTPVVDRTYEVRCFDEEGP